MKTFTAMLFIVIALFISGMAAVYAHNAPTWAVHQHQCMPHCTLNCDLILNQE